MDLRTKYLGLDLKNPLVPSASPMSQNLDNLRQMEDAGASAVVLFSLFEEQITHETLELDHYLDRDAEGYGEATSYFPDLANFNHGTEGYLEHIRKAKAAIGIPVIASLNGVTEGGWIGYAKKMEDAGADAIELNVYYIPTNPAESGGDVEQRYLTITNSVKKSVSIPVAVKLSPFFSSLPNMVRRLVDAGADGLVLFNRFYQPEIDLEELEVVPSLALSRSASRRMPMRWIAILRGHVKVSIAATTGVHTPEDAIRMVMAGADVTMMTAALLQNGIGHIKSLEAGISRWMEEHEYESIEQMKGSMSQQSCPSPAAFERGNYMKALASYDSTGQRR